MPYQAELLFLQKAFAKCDLQMFFLEPGDAVVPNLDFGLHKLLGRKEWLEDLYREVFTAKDNVIYRLLTPFLCSYIYFRLPQNTKPTVVMIGPFLSVKLSHEQLLEQMEQFHVPPELFRQIETYFSGIPVLTDDNSLFVMLETFAEQMWGVGDTFTVKEINQNVSQDFSTLFAWEDIPQPEDGTWNMQNLEARYAHENEILQAVSQGQTQKVEMLFAGFSELTLEHRLTDPVRNLKNYCIIMNTLLRKAAENGGVHPVYLDRISSEFARKIELMPSIDAAQCLMEEMYRNYCRLVRKNTTQHLSPPVQKAVLYIDANLNSDLSLTTLSTLQNINASYLSSLFKKETGKTITEYVNQKRVRRAAHLLGTTKLQVQTVAQHCGIHDVNYFSKIFKKYMGKTPKEYQKDAMKQTT